MTILSPLGNVSLIKNATKTPRLQGTQSYGIQYIKISEP
jgi:hypothetical protein